MLDTDQLRSFLAIVDTGSFTRAAERVNKTQSAVSMHIRRLEEQLGCALFIKQGRGTRLSEEGERLIDYARRIIQTEAGALAALSRKGLSGRVRLGMPDDYAEFFLAEILTRFCRNHPLVEISVVCESSLELDGQVRSGALDLAVVTETDGITGVEIIRKEQLAWVADKRFNLDDHAPVPVALGSTVCAWRQIAERALRAVNRPSRALFLSNNYSAIAPVVRAGLAVTILPTGCIPADLRVLGPESGLPPLQSSRMGIIHAPGRPSEEAAALADAIRATVGQKAQAAAAA
ncbi:MAG TPA: LysR substrate-binding domain-containing protein [Roseiarcus sp.]|jgi:DNA-binding transcriptional LysR family regulator|nr:LysR substrate-binding domain-containing protein [Roseiarcus sp.]